MRVLITGASSGIGEALARAVAGRHPDAKLGLVARRRPELETLAAGIGPDRCRVLAADLLVEGSYEDAARQFLDEEGVPDWVIANAGISGGTATGARGDDAVFARIVALNLTGMARTFSPFVSGMRARGSGRLVGVASVAGVRGMPGSGAYCASKAGAIAYLESLRVELRGTGVGVVTLAPGFVRTPLTAANPFPMPFLIDADEYARHALRAIEAGRRFSVTPWQMGWVARGLRWLPGPVFDRAFSRVRRKPPAEAGR